MTELEVERCLCVADHATSCGIEPVPFERDLRKRRRTAERPRADRSSGNNQFVERLHEMTRRLVTAAHAARSIQRSINADLGWNRYPAMRAETRCPVRTIRERERCTGNANA